MFDLSGRVAIVTGTAAGWGSTWRGAGKGRRGFGADQPDARKSCVHSRRRSRHWDDERFSLDLDVRKLESIERMVSEAEKAFGRLDILVNNAGCNVRKPALDVTWTIGI